MPKRIHEYEGSGIVVRFELARCIHAAECVRGLPGVFDPQRRPWVEPDRAESDAVAAVVERCPTGALTFERLDGGPAEEAQESNEAIPVPDGPLFVRGRLSISLADGESVETTRMALCRCGASRNKPFCDNRHLVVGFEDDGSLGESRLAPLEGQTDDTGPSHSMSVRPVPDGPILVEGHLTIRTAEGPGGEAGFHEGRKGALCRCGASRNRPYCDGSHVETGFSAD